MLVKCLCRDSDLTILTCDGVPNPMFPEPVSVCWRVASPGAGAKIDVAEMVKERQMG